MPTRPLTAMCLFPPKPAPLGVSRPKSPYRSEIDLSGSALTFKSWPASGLTLKRLLPRFTRRGTRFGSAGPDEGVGIDVFSATKRLMATCNQLHSEHAALYSQSWLNAVELLRQAHARSVLGRVKCNSSTRGVPRSHWRTFGCLWVRIICRLWRDHFPTGTSPRSVLRSG